jgi:hypothetical protein
MINRTMSIAGDQATALTGKRPGARCGSRDGWTMARNARSWTNPLRLLPRRGAQLASLVFCVFLTVTGSVAQASGSYEPDYRFFLDQQPDMPARQFIGAPGGFYTSYQLPYQVVWYWHLTGQHPTPAQTDALLRTIEPLAAANYDGALQRAVESWQEQRQQAVAELGGKAVPKPAEGTDAEVAGADNGLKPSRWDPNGSNDVVNCYGDAFINASKVLQAHRAGLKAQGEAGSDGKGREAILSWIAMQDWTFSHCSGAQGEAEPPLPAHPPQWLLHDRSYQAAAALFYADDLEGARKAYAALARDPANPWRHLAAYMQLRILARMHPGAEAHVDNGAATDQQRAEASQARSKSEAVLKASLNAQLDALLPALLGDTALAGLKPSIVRIAEALRIRYLNGKERLLYLSGALQKLGDPDLTAARLLLLERELRQMDYRVDKAPELQNGPDLLAWLIRIGSYDTFATEEAQTHYAWQRYLSKQEHREQSLPWLFAAASLTQAGSPNQAALQGALAAVPPSHPAFYAAQILQARYAYSLGMALAPALRARLQGFAALPAVQASISERNLLSTLLIRGAATEQEWTTLALRRTAAMSDPEAQGATPAPVPGPNQAPALTLPQSSVDTLDDDVIVALNQHASLPLWVRFANNPALARKTRIELLESAWTRAVLARRYQIAHEISLQLIHHYGDISGSGEEGQGAGSGKVKAESVRLLRKAAALEAPASPGVKADAQWNRVLMERFASPLDELYSPHLRSPFISAGSQAPLPTTQMNRVDSAIEANRIHPLSKWAHPLGLDPQNAASASAALEALPFLPAAERDAYRADLRTLSAIPPEWLYFSRSAQALMQTDKSDPLVPAVLSTSVKISRFGYHGTEGTSRAIWKILHDHYGRTAWARATPYWY